MSKSNLEAGSSGQSGVPEKTNRMAISLCHWDQASPFCNSATTSHLVFPVCSQFIVSDEKKTGFRSSSLAQQQGAAALHSDTSMTTHFVAFHG
jgi:hypothetical protein